MEDPDPRAVSEKLVADAAAEFASALFLQEEDLSSLEELRLGDKPLEEPNIATPGTLFDHNTIDGSWSSFPFSCEKLVAGAAVSASPHALKEPDLSSLDEFLDTTSEESMTASPRTVTLNSTDGSPTSVPSLGSKILIRSPPNWYEVFYIRMDRAGSFYMYPDLGGPFRCIDEVDIAINRYLDGLRRRARCKEPDNSNIVDRMVHKCKYYLDGTPKRGLGAPSKDTYDDKRHLIQALLDQYSEEHNLIGNLELEDILTRQWIYEDERCFYHVNFTTKKKEAGDNTSTGKIFFAEVSQMQGEDALEVNCCCMIEDDEDNGWCYGCINNGSPGMKHPKSTDAYAGGHLDLHLPFDYDYSSEDEQDEDEETRLRHMFEGLDDPHVWETLFPSDARSVEVDGI